MRIARNLVIDRSRRYKVRDAEEEVNIEWLVDPKQLPELDVIDHERITISWRLLGSLPENTREILILRYMLGWQVKQIAEHLEMSENYVSMTIRRGIKIKNFSESPSGWAFSYFWGDARARCIDMVYRTTIEDGTLVISQCGTEKRSDISVFPFRSIKRVKIGKNKGQYIAGGFTTTEDGKQIWDSTMPVKQLYWQQGGLWMNITLYGNQVLVTDKEDLILIAESLQ